MQNKRTANFLTLVAGVVAFQVVLVASSVGPASAGPGPCAGPNTAAAGGTASVAGFNATVHTWCTTGVPSGDATYCDRNTAGAMNANVFVARWASTSARLLDETGGCSFMCSSGDCRVGRDALPVELLQFGVE